jgi:hypothetical protein
MKLMAFAALALVAFIAIWFFIVVPAEKRHHERKLENVRRRIEKREAAAQDGKYTDPDS